MFESVSRQEIYRYLGYRGNQPDAAVCALVEDCLRKWTGRLSHGR